MNGGAAGSSQQQDQDLGPGEGSLQVVTIEWDKNGGKEGRVAREEKQADLCGFNFAG